MVQRLFRGAEKVQSRFRSANMHWCGGAEVQLFRYGGAEVLRAE